jgi:hypothetical protein
MKIAPIALFTLLLLLSSTAQNAPAQTNERLPIAIHLQNVDAREILGIVCNAAKLQLEMPQDIKETVTINLDKPTLREALDAIVKPVRLAYAIEGSQVRITRQ